MQYFYFHDIRPNNIKTGLDSIWGNCVPSFTTIEQVRKSVAYLLFEWSYFEDTLLWSNCLSFHSNGAWMMF